MRKFFTNPLTITAALIIIGASIFFSTRFNSHESPDKKIKTSGAMEMLDMWAMQRAYPGQVIQDAGYYSAYMYSKNNLIKEVDNIGGNEWQSIGPLNVSGRTLAIEFNPHNGNTIYAGSASGGLWRSYTGGMGVNAWSYIPTGFPVLGVAAIAVSPADTGTVYIGTGEVYAYQNSIGGTFIRTTRGSYGIGILKTTNNGLTWAKSLDWSENQKRGVQVVKINPKNSNVIWAGTTEGVFISRNAGASWTQISTTVMVTDLQINPIDTGTVFIACGNLNSAGNGIYRTLNSGGNWTKLTSGLPASYGGKAVLSMYKTSPNVLFASIGFGATDASPTQLCKTVDNGNTWVLVSDLNYASYQGWFAHGVGVNPLDSNKVLIMGVDIFSSTNGGVAFEQRSAWNIGYFGRVPIGGPEGPAQYSHADHHAMVYHPSNSDIVYFGNDGGVFRTTNGGITFESCNGGMQTTQFHPGFSSGKNDSLFAIGGLQDNGSVLYDGDLAWIKITGGDGCWTAINQRNMDTIYTSAQGLALFRSTNKGASFGQITVPPTNFPTSFVAPFVTANVNPQIMYAGRSVVTKTTDGGITWNPTNNGSPLNTNNSTYSIAVSRTNDDVVYAITSPVSTRAKVFKTTNGGTSWAEITGTLPDKFLTDIAINPINDQELYITVSGFGSSHLFKSTDGGTIWTDAGTGLPDVPTSSVIIDPSATNHVYVGNDIGVYLSTNGGTNWQEFQSGMTGAAIVIDLSISESNKKIRAITHGRGNYQRPLHSTSVSINNTGEIAIGYKLEQNYPNPFNPSTTISYQLSAVNDVKLNVYDINGKLLKSLVNSRQQAGKHSVTFDASGLASGTYFYTLTAGEFTQTKKMLLVK
jgi:photosystem II stability/assembly factor-like uncharacterized protein